MKKVLLGVTGSIAAYKSCEIASLLTQNGYEVYTVMTESATKFVTPLTLKTLTGKPVFTDMFADRTIHIHLAEEADFILVAPATANFISKLAGGIASDLLTLTIISSTAPVLICPAMNEKMYKNKIIQENVNKLKKYGYEFLGPYKGWLSCGYVGEGRLADPEDIVNEVKRYFE